MENGDRGSSRAEAFNSKTSTCQCLHCYCAIAPKAFSRGTGFYIHPIWFKIITGLWRAPATAHIMTRLIKSTHFTFHVGSEHASHSQRMHTHLAAVAGNLNIMPDVVVELPASWFHQGLEGAGAQVDDEPQGPVPQGQVDIVSWLPRVKQQAVPLQGAEGQRDLVHAALNGSLGQVVAEELIAFEGGHWLLLPWEGRRNILDNCYSHQMWFIQCTVLYSHYFCWLKWVENIQCSINWQIFHNHQN